MKSRTQNNRTAAAIFAVVMGGSLPVGADPITIPNAGFEDRETYDPFPEGTDKYNQYRSETWRHFDLGNNGGPLRIWNPGVPGVNETPQGIADVAFGGNAPEGKYMVVVRSRQNDPARTFEAATQVLEATFDSSMTYTLTAQVGRLPETDSGGSVNYDPDWFGYSLQFVVGGTNVDGAQYAGQVQGGTILAEDRDSQTVPVNEFITASVTYIPNPADAVHDGLPIQIRLAALETPVNPEDDSLAGWVAFDDVTLDVSFGVPAKSQFDIERVDDELVISWTSAPGNLYNLRSTTDPASAAPKDWPIFGAHQDLPATPETNTLTIPLPEDPERFFVIEEFLAPPVTVFSEDFDGADPGWTTGFDLADTEMNTAWELGDPSGGPNTGPAAAKSGTNCFGTNLSANYGLNSNTWLRSTAIDLTAAVGATLVFQQSVDVDDFENLDHGTIRVLDASALPGTVTELGVVQSNITGRSAGNWIEFSADLPPAALGQSIVLEFVFESDGDDVADGAGWYIDDVLVTTPAP